MAHLLPRAFDQLRHESVHDLGALEDVGVLEQVGLVGEDLLQSQRPLLIPGARKAKRLVPGGKLDRAGPRSPAERHRQRFERDPVDVVLGLRLGQPQRVDLHAIAEAAVLLVQHAVAVAAELVPQLGHRAQLRVLLDEPDARVDEERDSSEHVAHQILTGLPRGAARSRTASSTAIALLIA